MPRSLHSSRRLVLQGLLRCELAAITAYVVDSEWICIILASRIQICITVESRIQICTKVEIKPMKRFNEVCLRNW